MIPIVLVPAFLCTSDIFAPQIAALWPHGPVLVASTLRGNTMAEMAAAILAQCPPRFALAGISMGGYICQEIMRQEPHRVVKLALLDTQARADTPEDSTQRRSMVAQALTGNFEAFMTDALRIIVHPERQNETALLSVLVRMAMIVGPEGMQRQSEAMICRIDSRPFLSAIKVSTLVLVGDTDRLTPPAQAEEMASAIHGAELVVVPRCGHGSTLECPDAVNAALIEWAKR